MLTPIQMRAKVEHELRFRLNLRMYENVTSVTIEDDKIVVLTEIFKVRELRRETRYEARGTHAIQFAPHEPIPGLKLWRKLYEMTIWDDDFEPTVYATLRNVLTPTEWNDKRSYEADCYRPGTGSFPMDNYDRTVLNATETDPQKMARHWAKVGRKI